eukprot:m.88048 g.88048  ORF g.88048 m.88048 type:complete len:195 (-) comp16426_c0_seq2:467-1051(-)
MPSTTIMADTDNMPLTHPYSFWFSERPQQRGRPVDYENNIKLLGTFHDVKSFWSYFGHMTPAGELSGVADYHLFKDGVKPMWEDPVNEHGGKWILRLRKGLASRMWEKLVIALIGDQFEDNDDICGAVIQLRFHEDKIALWNKSTNPASVQTINETIRRVLGLPTNTIMEYKPHNASFTHSSRGSASFQRDGFR